MDKEETLNEIISRLINLIEKLSTRVFELEKIVLVKNLSNRINILEERNHWKDQPNTSKDKDTIQHGKSVVVKDVTPGRGGKNNE